MVQNPLCPCVSIQKKPRANGYTLFALTDLELVDFVCISRPANFMFRSVRLLLSPGLWNFAALNPEACSAVSFFVQKTAARHAEKVIDDQSILAVPNL
jgi:hypothetical protein